MIPVNDPLLGVNLIMRMLKKVCQKCYNKYINFYGNRRISLFKKQGMRPWQNGYSEYHTQELMKILNHSEMMQIFKQSKQLPGGYGFRLDERIIEYPWVLSRLPKGHCRVLDAGSTLNFGYLITNPIISNKDLYIITLSPEPQCFWKRKVSYIWSDLRDNPFKDNYFDFVICISTLEHIGMNNVMYTNDNEFCEDEPTSFVDVIKEFNRVLKPNGILYVTVPYGKYRNYGFFQQFDADLVQKVIETFKGSCDEINYYQYLERGWVLSEERECSTCEYFDIHQTKYFDKQSNKDYAADYAAAARAVVCMKLSKSKANYIAA